MEWLCLPKIALVLVRVLFLSTMLAGQQKPFPVTSVVDAPTIAGHPVQLDERGKLLPWPIALRYRLLVFFALPYAVDNPVGPSTIGN